MCLSSFPLRFNGEVLLFQPLPSFDKMPETQLVGLHLSHGSVIDDVPGKVGLSFWAMLAELFTGFVHCF